MTASYTVSVIVPVYNTRQYLRECLDSVCRDPGFERYEVLLVDDGSTDDSARIMREYAARYANVFTLAHGKPPENRGLASARNLGLRSAHGQYVFFLDSDDAVRDQYISRLYERITAEKCDIVYAGFSRWNGDRATPVNRPVLSEGGVMPGRDFIARRMDLRDDCNYVWCALYRASLFSERGVAFQEGVRLYEDLPFTLLAACAAKRVCAVPLYGYLYRRRPGSLIGDEIGQRDVEATLEALKTLFGDPKYQSDPVCGRYDCRIVSMCLYYLGMLTERGNVTPAFRKKVYRELKAMIPLREMLEGSGTLREKVKWRMWRAAPGLFYPIVRKQENMSGDEP